MHGPARKYEQVYLPFAWRPDLEPSVSSRTNG
ncbi:hypothetical protein RS9916_26159 [Synechococcus sp. RS9916]|nr:hypothetical protein RS9916_26159 [Synechococcus sp. RS9916]